MSTQPKLLLIEDERGLVQSLTWYFNREGYETIVANDGNKGLLKAQTLLPDAVLLDIMLPGLDGLSICRELRAGDHTRDIPIIMITAKSEETDQLIGYNAGADDYVTKPFSNKILLQKVKALLRRVDGQSEVGEVIEHLGLKIDRVRHRVAFENKKLNLTPTEFRLLECLLRQPGRAFNRHQLMDAAIGEGQTVLDRNVDGHIKRLRRKLKESTGTDASMLLETVRGVGYRIRENGDPFIPAVLSEPTVPSFPAGQLARALAEITGSVCHDLLSHTAAMRSLIELASDRSTDTKQYLQTLEEVVGEVCKLVLDTRGFMHYFYHRPAFDQSVVKTKNLRSWLHKYLISITEIEGVKLRIRLSSLVPSWTIPAVLLRVIAGTLVRNSVEAFASEMKKKERYVEVLIQGIDSGRGVRIQVTDNGPGWPTTYQFKNALRDGVRFSTKDEGRGYGIQTVGRIARLLGGGFTIGSTEQSGAIIDVRFEWSE